MIRRLSEKAIALFIATCSLTPLSAMDVTDSYTWWEGEEASQTNIPIDGQFTPQGVEQEAKLSGGKWLNTAAYTNGDFAKYTIDVKKTGSYSFFTRRFWNHGPFRWSFDGGQWHDVIHPPGFLDTTAIRTKVDASWIPLGDIKLSAGTHTCRIEMIKAEGLKHTKACAFDCFVLSSSFFVPNGISRPNAKYNRADPGTWAFEPGLDNFAPSEIDLSYLNEQEAGENGWIYAKGDKLYYGNGEEARLWSVEFGNHNLNEAALNYMGQQLRKRGVNMVRLFWPTWGNNWMPNNINSVDEHLIESYHRTIASMKKHGIYVKICTYFVLGTRIKHTWGIDGFPDYLESWYQPFNMLVLNETLQDAHKERFRKLLLSTNPYTGIPLIKDPTVAIIQTQNEDGVFFGTYHENKFVEPQWDKMSEKFGSWLTNKYGSIQAAYDTWGLDTETNNKLFKKTIKQKDQSTTFLYDNPKKGRVQPFGGYNLSVNNSAINAANKLWKGKERKAHAEDAKRIGAAIDARRTDTMTFLLDLQTSYYQDMLSFFHDELKYQGLITSCNWRGTWDANLLDAERATYRYDDVIDNHHYVSPQHHNPTDNQVAKWDVRTGDSYRSMSALHSPWIMPNSYKHYADKPNIISECTWSNPNEYQCESPLLVAAYACLNGLDGFNWFSVYVPGFESRIRKFPVAVPNIMGQFPAMALLYRKGYIKESPVVAHEDRTLADITSRKKNPLVGESYGYDPTRDSGFSTDMSETAFGKYPLAYCVGKTTWRVGDISKQETLPALTKNVDQQAKTVRSATDEITLNWGTGLCVVDAPKAQGFTGFSGADNTISCTDLSITLENNFGAVIVVPLDDQPLATSKKMLVQAVINSRPYGYKEEPTEFRTKKGRPLIKGMKIIDTGKAPYNVPFILGSVTFKNPITSATALDGNGYPLAQNSATIDKQILTLPQDALYTIVTR